MGEHLDRRFLRRRGRLVAIIRATFIAPLGVAALWILYIVAKEIFTVGAGGATSHPVKEMPGVILFLLVATYPIALVPCILLSRLIALFKSVRHRPWPYLLAGGLVGGCMSFLFGMYMMKNLMGTWQIGNIGWDTAIWTGFGFVVAFLYWWLAPYRNEGQCPGHRPRIAQTPAD